MTSGNRDRLGLRAKLLSAGVVLSVAFTTTAAMADASGLIDEATQPKVDALLEKFATADISKMPALPVQEFTMPQAGVDILRAQVEETYSIDGIGEETVVLTGWIAVAHSDPISIIDGEVATWGNSRVGTQFVGLDLRGESDLFGPIVVSLNDAMPSIGGVGAWEGGKAPDEFLHSVGLTAEDIDGMTPPPGCEPPNGPINPVTGAEEIKISASIGDGLRLDKGGDQPEAEDPWRTACACYAPLAVRVSMTDLDLDMETDRPVLMFSRVTTIPPVDYSASTSVTPRKLLSNGREVGQLESAAVKFREIIHHMPLNGSLLDDRFVLELSSN